MERILLKSTVLSYEIYIYKGTNIVGSEGNLVDLSAALDVYVH
jgi:hypothetical protein